MDGVTLKWFGNMTFKTDLFIGDIQQLFMFTMMGLMTISTTPLADRGVHRHPLADAAEFTMTADTHYRHRLAHQHPWHHAMGDMAGLTAFFRHRLMDDTGAEFLYQLRMTLGTGAPGFPATIRRTGRTASGHHGQQHNRQR
jgi:hypothetical protein